MILWKGWFIAGMAYSVFCAVFRHQAKHIIAVLKSLKPKVLAKEAAARLTLSCVSL